MSHSALSSLAGRDVLLLSPHADDIAYSLGGLIAATAAQTRYGMVTVFSQSAWALPARLRTRPHPEISALRRAEDQVYCRRHGIRHEQLDFQDAALLGLDARQELSMDVETDPRLSAVVAAVGACIARHRPWAVLAPCALGDHIDHQLVRRAAEAHSPQHLYYYEDIPYASTRSLLDVETQLCAQGLEPWVTVPIDETVQLKCEDMWLYRTQTSAPTVAEMLLHAERVRPHGTQRAERLWQRRAASEPFA
ncbi:PIG-L family deacetylase [Mitsuaria sp. WAJ17]|uniref:PIG-L deacetylase family protein n=1 Tax=Mitsuaria sp. WAJ17 TaxID=2761452 RepID=UPI001600544E|nr:PIG-L family deacetylase [Mitsuaria sp. WAJ17]MBB2485177.1 PIG-L family deacetylase [Mitsuaria sp. WAJ17]